MSRALRLFAAVILIALLPLRAVAGVTIGFCPAGHEDMAVAAHATGHGHGAHSHAPHGDATSPDTAEQSCEICTEHCSSAAFAPGAPSGAGVLPVGRDRARLADHLAPAFITEQLDRPPLA